LLPHALCFAVAQAGSASGARLSHSGTQSNLLLAAQPGSGLEVMVGTGEEEEVEVMDAADYGQYSAVSLGIVGSTAERQLSFSHERAVQQRLIAVGENADHQQQQGLGARGSTALAAAVNEAWLPVSMVDTASNSTTDQTAGRKEAGTAAAAAGLLGSRQPQPSQSADQQQQQQLMLVSGVLEAQEKAAGLLCEQQLVELTASGTFELTATAAAARRASGGV
jgi:hypothetical protein